MNLCKIARAIEGVRLRLCSCPTCEQHAARAAALAVLDELAEPSQAMIAAWAHNYAGAHELPTALAKVARGDWQAMLAAARTELLDAS